MTYDDLLFLNSSLGQHKDVVLADIVRPDFHTMMIEEEKEWARRRKIIAKAVKALRKLGLDNDVIRRSMEWLDIELEVNCAAARGVDRTLALARAIEESYPSN